MKSPIELFRDAEKFCRENGFDKEIEWCEQRPTFNRMLDWQILKEYAWVVFNSGMRNSVIEAKWQEICEAFRFFNLKFILDEPDTVLKEALNVFGHYNKVGAVIEFAEKLWKEGSGFRNKVNENPLDTLTQLSFIGDITKYHLARNLGFDFIKPDRHLTRLGDRYGLTAFELCNLIHEKTGRRLGTIDVILWRYCEQKGQTKLRLD